MTIQLINTGTSANSGNGDSLRTAFTKINNNFQELSGIVTDIDRIDDIIGGILSTSNQSGISVSYNTTTNLASFTLLPATTSTIGGIIVDSGLTVDPDGRLMANFGDIVITNNIISTKFDDEDIILQPSGSAGIAKIRIINHAIQFDNGAGDAYDGQLIYTNPISAAGIGISDSNHSIRIVGDTITLGLIADFGLYNAIRGTWNSLISMDYLGNLYMDHNDIIFGANNKGIQFHDGSKQTTAYIPSQSTSITPISINPPSTFSTGTTWYDPDSGRLYIYYDNFWIDASPNGGGGGGNIPNDLTAVASNIIPSQNITYDLGSLTNQWRSLYVSSSTIYIGGAELSVTGNNLTLNGTPVQNENLEIDGGYASTTFTTADLDVDGGGA